MPLVAAGVGLLANCAPAAHHEFAPIPTARTSSEASDFPSEPTALGVIGTSTTVEIIIASKVPRKENESTTPTTLSPPPYALPSAEARALLIDLIPELEAAGLRPLPDIGDVNDYSDILLENENCAGQFSVSKGDENLPIVTGNLYGPAKAFLDKDILDKDGSEAAETVHEETPFGAPAIIVGNPDSKRRAAAYVSEKLALGCERLRREGMLKR